MTNLTCDFEYAKKLKKLGYPQGKSYFVFTKHVQKFEGSTTSHTITTEVLGRDNITLTWGSKEIICDAPTAQELLEWLPKAPPGNRDYILTVEKDGEDFNVTWNLWESEGLHHYFKFSILHLANYAAKAAIWILENKLVEIK